MRKYTGSFGSGVNAIWPEHLASRFNASRTLGDEQDFNRAKMEFLFGPDPTSKVVDAVNQERTFADTAGKVPEGSRSALMATVSKALMRPRRPAHLLDVLSSTSLRNYLRPRAV